MADKGLSPAGMAKFDIRSGTAVKLYEKRFQGYFTEDLWFFEEGHRFIARTGIRHQIYQ